MKIVRWITVVLLNITLFLQGLYFDQMVMSLILLTTCLLFYIFLKNKQLQIPKDKGFYFFVFYFLSHIIGYATFVEKGMLVMGIARSVLFIMVYLLIFQLYTKAMMLLFKQTFLIAVLVGAILSTLSYLFGFWPELQYVINGRLAGPIQYANTNAIILLVAILIIISLRLRWMYKILGMTLLIIPLLLTMSRSAVVISILVVLCYFILNKWDKDGRDTWDVATKVSVVSSTLISTFIVSLMDSKDSLDRISGMNLNASEWQTRILYYSDGIKMIFEHPQGLGPYGYYYLQRSFQTGSTYYVKWIHNSVLQIMLDIGIIAGAGFIIFMAYMVFFRKYPLIQRMIVMALLGHSIIDIDMAFAYVVIIIIVFMQSDNHRIYIKVPLHKNSGYITMMALIITVIASLYMLAATMAYSYNNYKLTLKLYPHHTEAIRRSFNGTSEDAEKVALANALLVRNPYIIEGHEILFKDAIQQEAYDVALIEARTLVELNSLEIKRYENLSYILRRGGETLLLKEDYLAAKPYFVEILQMPQLLERLAKEKHTNYNVKHVPTYNMTKSMISDLDVAKKWLDLIENYVGGNNGGE